MPISDLETRTMEVLAFSPISVDDFNKLLQDLATARETDALVRIWDMRGKIPISKETWTAMLQLHSLGKGRVPEGTIHPPHDRRRLPPARRLHKICKFKESNQSMDDNHPLV